MINSHDYKQSNDFRRLISHDFFMERNNSIFMLVVMQYQLLSLIDWREHDKSIKIKGAYKAHVPTGILGIAAEWENSWTNGLVIFMFEVAQREHVVTPM